MARKVFPFKDVNYGASKTSTSANQALNPFDLREGALGIYGVQPTNRKLELIVDGTAKPYEQIVFAVGTKDAADVSDVFDVKGISITSKAYNAATRQVLAVGYHPSFVAGRLNLPTSIMKGDEGIIVLNDNNNLDRYLMVGKNYSGYATFQGAIAYDILFDLYTRLHNDANRLANLEIFSNGTSTAIVAGTHYTGSGTAQIALTNGSKDAVVTSTGISATTLVAGNFLRLNNATYRIEAVSAVAANAFTITLDRPYAGATQGATNVSTTTGGVLTSITEYGFTLTDSADNLAVKLSLSGIFASASVNLATAGVQSNGAGKQIELAEIDTRPSFGSLAATIDRTVPLKGLLTDVALTYDMYVIKGVNDRHTSDPHNNGRSNVNVEILLAFDSVVADTGGKNQSNFEDIMGTDFGKSFVSLF